MISLPARSSVVTSICLILTFLVAAVLIVVLFFCLPQVFFPTELNLRMANMNSEDYVFDSISG